MKVCCISDTHGSLPTIQPCDLLLIAGDICGHKEIEIFGRGKGYLPGSHQDVLYQAAWLCNDFRKWLDTVPAKDVVATPGNHDFVFETASHLIPKDLRWHLLIDDVKVVQGKKIYGSPWQHWFGDWAYNAPKRNYGGEEFLERKFSLIPDDTNIIIVHGPPYSFGDGAPIRDVFGRPTGNWEMTGSTSLQAAILRVKPDISVHGHIHMGRGSWKIGRGNRTDCIVVNAAICNETNDPIHEPLYFDI